MNATALSNRALFARIFANDIALGLAPAGWEHDEYESDAKELERELCSRFGEAAANNLTNYCTGWRFTPQEMVEWAADYPDQVEEVCRTGDYKRRTPFGN